MAGGCLTRHSFLLACGSRDVGLSLAGAPGRASGLRGGLISRGGRAEPGEAGEQLGHLDAEDAAQGAAH